MAPAIKCLIVLAIVALLFITELIPLAITAMSGAIACGLWVLSRPNRFFQVFPIQQQYFSQVCS